MVRPEVTSGKRRGYYFTGGGKISLQNHLSDFESNGFFRVDFSVGEKRLLIKKAAIIKKPEIIVRL